MKPLTIVAAFGWLAATTANAQQPASLDQVLKELAALSARVGRLEQDNAALRAENEELKAKNDRIEATTEYLRDNASATRKTIAEDAPRIAEADRVAKAAEWASRISWKADLRYRHETVDPEEAVEAQDRHRVRARFGLTAKINDTLSGTIQLATNGGNNDPRSTNQTLGEGWARKGIGLDLAYVEWKPVNGLSVLAGKMPQPWHRTSSLFWDGDITPEGLAVKYVRGPFFANAFGHYLSERSTANESTLIGGQLGATLSIGTAKLTGALGYYDVGGVEGQITTAATGCTVNNAFFGGPQGNTTVAVGGCATLANDFNLLEGLVQADLLVGTRPLVLFAQYMENQEASGLDTAWAAGVTLGRASAPKSWEVGYLYQSVQKDSQFGQFVDSDFGGGVTDSEGSVLRFGYAPARNWVLNGTYFMNQRFVDAPGAIERDYERYQIDLNYRF
ncbi:MAG: putative porin [Gammaproteobacteria bacterium]